MKENEYVLVPLKDMMKITAVIDSYEARNPFPASNPNHKRIKDVCEWMHNGRFSIVKTGYIVK